MNPTTMNRIIMLLGASGVVLLSIFLYRQAVNKTEVKIDLGPLGQPGVVTVFRQVNRVSGLPMSVVREFHDDLANPNENFQKTDVVRGKGLKMRRLVFAALSRDYCIVYFEHGGIATTFYIVLFRSSENTASAVWVSSSVGRLSNIRELKDLLETGHLANQVGTVAW